jgi:hypothetical protein
VTPALETAMRIMEERAPQTMEACYPRKIIPPNGFPNPKWFAGSLVPWFAFMERRDLTGQAADCNMASMGMRLMQFKFPTYFVTKDFAESVVQSNPPSDLLLRDIKWPMQAMLFTFPHGFIKGIIGHDVPFLAIARLPAGDYPTHIINDLPALDRPWNRLPVVHNLKDRYVLMFQVMTSSLPIEYTGCYNLNETIEALSTRVLEAGIDDRTYEIPGIRSDSEVPKTGSEEEKKLNAWMNGFSVSLLMAMTARPDLVEQGQCLRPAKFKHGRVKPELWSPNIIGRTYRILRVPSADGTHASPRMHWRRGHYRHQRYGLGLQQVRVIWIEPVLVGG